MSQHNQQTSINPWPGLSSYKEPKGEAPLLFCGRNREIEDLVVLIKDHIFTTLYGSSGLGKTSLLNAGVFPRIKKEGCFFPINLRLKLTPKESSFQEFIISTIKEEVKKANLNIVEQNAVISQYDLYMPTDTSSSDYLWTFFALNRFINAENQSVTLILAFDQFEEVLLSHPEDTATLLKQVLFLMNNDNHLPSFKLDGKTYNYEENYRFIVTLREDDLFLLEDIIDNNYLHSMKNNRYRLRELSPEAAKEVIQIPGKDCLCKEQIDDITNQIIEYSKDDDGTISSSMISFLCNRLYTRGKGFITSELVKENGGKTLKEFCQEQLAKLPPEEFDAFTRLLIDDGRRRQVLYEKFHKEVPSGDFLFEEESKLLDTVTIRKRANVEIIHDKFAAIIPEIKKELDAAAITEQLTKEKEEAENVAEAAKSEAEEAYEAKNEADRTSNQIKRKNKRLKWYLLLAIALASGICAAIWKYYSHITPTVIMPEEVPTEVELIFIADETLAGYDWKANVCFTDMGIDSLEMKESKTNEPIITNKIIEIKAKGDMNQNPDTIRLTMPKRKQDTDIKVHLIPVNLCSDSTYAFTIKSDSTTNTFTKSFTLTRSDSAKYTLNGTVFCTTDDNKRKPLFDALVIVGDEVRHTDANGKFTFYLNDISELGDKTIYALKNEYEHREIKAEDALKQLQGKDNQLNIQLTLKENYQTLFDDFLHLTCTTYKKKNYIEHNTVGIDTITPNDSIIIATYLSLSSIDKTKPTYCTSKDTTFYLICNNSAKSLIGYYQTGKGAKKPFTGTMFKKKAANDNVQDKEKDKKKEEQEQWQLTISAFDKYFNRERISGTLTGTKLERN